MLSILKFVQQKVAYPNKNMTISEDGVEFIKEFEKLELEAYPDQGGIWTIGWGTIKGVKKGMKIDLQTAQKWFLRDLQEAENAVRKLITVPLEQNEYDALVSFTFNCGVGALQVSTLRKLLNTGDYESVPDQLKRWNKVKVKGKYIESNGLTRRRAKEAEFFAQ